MKPVQFSNRLPWNVPANSWSELLAQQAGAGENIIDLTVSNPTAVLDDYPHAAIGQALASVRDFRYRPDPAGLESARLAIASHYHSLGYHIEPNQIVLTASTSESYALLFKLLCDAGNEILVPTPSYPLFEHLASCENVRILPYPLRYDGAWYIDTAELERIVTPRTRALVLVNPNNPTGSFLKRNELNALPPHPLIADEVFGEYAFTRKNEAITTVAAEASCLSFSLNGLSKMAGMPQMKLGWIVVGGPVQEKAEALARLHFLADTYLSVNTPVQEALPSLLRIGGEIRERLRRRTERNLQCASDLLHGSTAHVLWVEAGWSAIIRLPASRSDEEWASDLLIEHSVLTQPGFFFDLPGGPYLVVSLITPEETFAAGITKLRQMLIPS